MYLKLNINEDVEYFLRSISKKKNKDMAVVASDVLKQYVSEQDEKQFEKSDNNKQTPKNLPDPNKANLDMISIGELLKLVQYWNEKFGPNSILCNNTPYNIVYQIKING
jgi:hypothetical protein